VKSAIAICKADPKCDAMRSKEPSDYIWDNLGITKKQQRRNQFIVLACLAIIMILAYKYQFEMQAADAKFDKFEQIDCKLYADKLARTAGPDYLRVRY